MVSEKDLLISIYNLPPTTDNLLTFSFNHTIMSTRKLLFIFAILMLSCSIQSFAQSEKKSMLKHIVFFKFKESASTAGVDSLVNAFKGLKTSIKEIKAFEWGTNNSPEKLNEGLTHCFQATFATEADRDAYLIHPAHKAFVDQFAKAYVDKAVVLDYWVQ